MNLLVAFVLTFAALNDPGIQAQLGSSPSPGSGSGTTMITPQVSAGCLRGVVRLEGGRTDSEGRVEICINGEWGTVCDDQWEVEDANVVCNQLGFLNTGAMAHSYAYFGQGTGIIWLDNVSCSGTESRLIDCPANLVGVHNCGHGEDAGVVCDVPECSDGDVRLEEGCTILEGRVEICANRMWGTVCDDSWGMEDANVVCYQLGFSSAGAIPFSHATFGSGSGSIWLDEVGCTGFESRLIDCPANPVVSHNCGHREDAGVQCQDIGSGDDDLTSFQLESDCFEGDLRLEDGSNIFEGRVEVCADGEWGTVCDDLWDNMDASVVCHQLGFSSTDAIAHRVATFGRGTCLSILLDSVTCSGSESRLLDCPSNPVGVHDCSHSEDAGVQCAVSDCSYGDLRLVRGDTTTEGRVEICEDEEWGTVCDDLWDTSNANVVCQQLGFANTGATAILHSYTSFGVGTGSILLDNVGCSGRETRLIDCPANPVGMHNCNHMEDAGVRCVTSDTAAPCDHGEVRLVGGCDGSEGRVEVCVYGLWGTVCGSSWGNNEAEVVCDQLGLPYIGATGFTGSQYGQGGLLILIEGVVCEGNEVGLLNCSTGPFGIHNCDHSEEVSVTRNPARCSNGAVRLVGGAYFYEGRVEICLNGVWGTVCDDSWGAPDANVVCRKLGFMDSGAESFSSAHFGEGCGSIALDDLNCYGFELRPQDCDKVAESDFRDCGHHKDAGVRCKVTDITFLPFGPEANSTMITTGPHFNITFLGPLRLQVPIVYYLQREYQLYVSSTGMILWSQGRNYSDLFSLSAVPNISPSWNVFSQEANAMLYGHVSQDPLVLESVRKMITNKNAELSSFQPSLAVVITWHNNVSEEIGPAETLQAILSTNGRASFAHFLFDDGESIRALAANGVMVFSAGDGERMSTSDRGSPNSQALRDTLDSFRIDGHCITVLTPDRACGLDFYTVGCEKGLLHASACSCYQLENTTSPDPDDEGADISDSNDISCVSGSALVMRHLGEGSEFTGCYPTLLPCYISESCSYSNDELNCTSSSFFLFGEGTGDIIGPREDDGVTGSIPLTVPVVYFGQEHTSFYVSTNVLLSFGDAHDAYSPCDLPCTPVPIMTPGWTDWTFHQIGSVYYRTTLDQATLDQVVRMITDVNPGLSDYQPTLAVIVTWFEATLLSDKSIVDTFQVAISTDGRRSFAALIYTDPFLLFSSINTDSSADSPVVGFDSSSGAHADIGKTLLLSNQTLKATNIYRIDGSCITTVSPGDVCGLEGVATECDPEFLAATTCYCEKGYQHQGMDCKDINECEISKCHQNSNCSNTVGSFECTCHTGFAGTGLECNDIDECVLGFCGNDSECFNTVGSFSCICNTGYVMDGLNSCIVISPVVGSSSSPVPAIASVLVIIAVLVTIAVIVVYLIMRKRKNKLKHKNALLSARNPSSNLEESGENEYFQRLRRMTVQSSFNLKVSNSLLVNSCNLQLGKSIGQGEFGIVYKGLLKKGFNQGFSETVAVKTLKGFLEKDLVKDLLKECAKMKEFDHPNVLNLRGVCLDGGPAPYIIMPFMTNGSLQGHLKENRASLVIDPKSKDIDDMVDTQKKLLDMCIQVAKGMEYLASKRLIHRDLAARNCMIDSGFVIKVADFGLSESMDTTKEYFRQGQDDTIKLPIKWLAMESISDGVFSEKTDVWAYGVTCWEIFTGGKTPYPGIHPLELSRQLETGYRMEKPLNAACTEDMYGVVLTCWERFPEDRPHFSELVNRFSTFLSSMADYFDFVLSNPALPEASACGEEKTNEVVAGDTSF